MKKLAVIILAAGKSTRMKSAVPKVLHPLCGRPMISYVLDVARGLKAQRIVVVLGYKHEEVRTRLLPGVTPVIQKKLRGTADALKSGLSRLKGFGGTVLVLYGDMPLVKAENIRKLVDEHATNGAAATLLVARVDKPAEYGRILRDEYDSIKGIVEAKDANDFQKEIKEINTGIVCFDAKALNGVLSRVKANNRKREFYLTDTIAMLHTSGAIVEGVALKDMQEAMGVNSREELAQANKVMQGRVLQGLMQKGVSIIDPGSTFIGYGARIGEDTVIYPFTVIETDVIIGRRCSVGPFAHLREGTCLEDDCIAGNFLELVRTRISRETWIKHFGYLGDTTVGRGANIGAGTVTANFDGRRKQPTTIKEKAFIGCDTVFVAPVRIGKGAVTGAGSVVLKGTRVADKATVVGIPARPLQRQKVKGKRQKDFHTGHDNG